MQSEGDRMFKILPALFQIQFPIASSQYQNKNMSQIHREAPSTSTSTSSRSASLSHQHCSRASHRVSPMAAATAASQCIFCQIATKSTSTTLLHTDEKVVAFQDIRPSAVRHYLVIPVDHIPTVKDLQRRPEDYSLVSHMLEVGKLLIQRDAPQCHQYKFGFHQPPFNSVDHLHLHCFALPFTPRWKCMKYMSVGSIGFLEAEKLLGMLKPLS